MTDAANEPFVDEEGNDLSCPRCGAKSGLSIQGDVTGIWATVQPDGTLKYDVTAHEGFVYGDFDPAHCTHCDWTGSASDLIDNTPPPPPRIDSGSIVFNNQGMTVGGTLVQSGSAIYFNSEKED